MATRDQIMEKVFVYPFSAELVHLENFFEFSTVVPLGDLAVSWSPSHYCRCCCCDKIL